MKTITACNFPGFRRFHSGYRSETISWLSSKYLPACSRFRDLRSLLRPLAISTGIKFSFGCFPEQCVPQLRELQEHMHLGIMFLPFKLPPSFQLLELLYLDFNKSATGSRQILCRKAHQTCHASPDFQGGLYELALLVLAEVSTGCVTT